MHPSFELLKLIQILEKIIVEVVGNEDINANTIFQVTEALERISPLPFVGCKNHKTLLTRRIIIFFITTRMQFICKQANKNHNIEQEMTKEKRKAAKTVNIVHENTSNKNSKKRIASHAKLNNQISKVNP